MRREGYGPEGCPEAERACNEVFSLPVFAGTSREDIVYIAHALKESIAFLKARGTHMSGDEIRWLLAGGEAVEAYAAIFSRKSEFPRIRDFSRAVAEVAFPFQVVLEKLGHQARKLHAEKHVHSLR